MNGAQDHHAEVVKAFISYSHADRAVAGQVQRELDKIGIESFLAHEDIEVSSVWKRRILQELRGCDVFVPILSENFRNSKWASQEAGFIASRPETDVVVVPLCLDETIPYGFMEEFQGARIGDNQMTPALWAEPLIQLADRVPRKLMPGLIRMVAAARSFGSAEATMGLIMPLLTHFSAAEAQTLAEASVDNDQVWGAWVCQSTYLPAFIETHEDNIKPSTLRALRFQLENRTEYVPSPEEVAETNK